MSKIEPIEPSAYRGGNKVLSVILAGTLALGMTPAVALSQAAMDVIPAYAGEATTVISAEEGVVSGIGTNVTPSEVQVNSTAWTAAKTFKSSGHELLFSDLTVTATLTASAGQTLNGSNGLTWVGNKVPTADALTQTAGVVKATLASSAYTVMVQKDGSDVTRDVKLTDDTGDIGIKLTDAGTYEITVTTKDGAEQISATAFNVTIDPAEITGVSIPTKAPLGATSGKSIAESVEVSGANGTLEMGTDKAYSVTVKLGEGDSIHESDETIAAPGTYTVTVVPTDNYELKDGVAASGSVSVEAAEEYSAKFVTQASGLEASSNGTVGTVPWSATPATIASMVEAGVKVYPAGSATAINNGDGDDFYKVTYTDENGDALVDPAHPETSITPQLPGEYGVVVKMNDADEPLNLDLTLNVVANLGKDVVYTLGNYSTENADPTINLLWNKDLTTPAERMADVLEQFGAVKATLDNLAETPVSNDDLLFQVTSIAATSDKTGTVTVTPASKDGFYTGSCDITYAYGDKLPAFSLKKASDEYNAAEGYPVDSILNVPSVKDEDGTSEPLTKNDDYTVSVTYVDEDGEIQPVDDGIMNEVRTYTVTVSGMDKYAGTQTFDFTVEPYEVSGTEVFWEKQDNLSYDKDADSWHATFTGSEIKPAPSYKINLESAPVTSGLVEKSTVEPAEQKAGNYDYEIVYENNTDKGAATAVVTFNGNYSGTVELPFDIEAAKLKDLGATAKAQNQLVGSFPENPTPEQVEGVKVELPGGTVLEEGDYVVKSVKRVSTDKNGESDYEFVVEGQGNYSGEITGTFKTVTKDIAMLFDAVVEEGDYVYEMGDPVLANVTVKTKPTSTRPAGSPPRGSYEVVCSSNTNAGTATAKVVGTGDYAGTIELTYEIEPLQISQQSAANIALTQNTYTYAPGIEAQPEINWKTAKITPSNHAEVALNDLVNDLEITYVNNDKAGTAQAVITGKEGGNVSGSYAVDFTINPADIAKATVEAASVTPGSAVEDAVSVKFGDATLVAGTDYTVAAEGTLPGKVTATVTGTGNYAGTATADVDVLYDVAGLDYKVSSGTYNGQSQTPVVTASYKDASGKTVEVPAAALNVAAGSYVNAGKYTVKVTGNNAAGWGGEKALEYTIAPATVAAKPQVSYDAAGLPVVTVPGLTSNDFTYKADAATKTITVTYKGNYKGTATVAYAPTAKPVAPAKPAAGKTGWVGSGNDWAYYENGKAVKGQWKWIGDAWYHFEKSGKMTNTKWFQDADGTWYLLNQSHKGHYGAMLTGWQKVGKDWYYMNKSGAMQSGWAKVKGEWYLLNTSHDGTYGRMLTGWQQVGGKWYYMDASGAMAENEWVGRYWVNGSGVWTATR